MLSFLLVVLLLLLLLFLDLILLLLFLSITRHARVDAAFRPTPLPRIGLDVTHGL